MADIASVTVEGPRRVVFHFKSNPNRELPLILGQMPVLPKHWWDGRDFDKPLTDPPLGSGPYRVGHFEFGRSLSSIACPTVWSKDLPTDAGAEQFRHACEPNISATRRWRWRRSRPGRSISASENIAKQWATAYDFPAVQKGLVKKEALTHHLPTGMQGFGMNTRRPLFKDVRVRHALAMAFDFEWANKNLFYGAYTRTKSYFSNSELASSGIPEGDELALLDKYRDQLPPDLFTKPFELPVTDGSGNNREELRGALELLEQAGWKVQDRKLVDANGQPFSFEILLDATVVRARGAAVRAVARASWGSRPMCAPSIRRNISGWSTTYDYDMIVVCDR